MPKTSMRSWPRLAALGAGLVLSAAAVVPALAVTIELKDVAADRIQRQRAFAKGQIPLPGTPDTVRFSERLAAAGLKSGAPILIRIFKAQSELELWIEKDGGEFVLFATYPICNWSGTLGPKFHEGDKQTPEGFYTVTKRQLHRVGRWKHALNLGFPNAYDESLKRDGSYILVHGGCSSVGCFAMTDSVVSEIFRLTSAALRGGQYHVPVHVFPFRMTEQNLASHRSAEWSPFWQNLKEGYDAFERTHRPPRVSVCDSRYRFDDVRPAEAGPTLPLAVCGPAAAAIRATNRSAWLVPLEPPRPELERIPSPPLPDRADLTPPPHPSQDPLPRPLPTRPEPQAFPMVLAPQQPAEVRPLPAPRSAASLSEPVTDAKSINPDLDYELIPRLVAVSAARASDSKAPCSTARTSCRKFVALRTIREAKARTGMPRKQRTAAAKSR